MCERCDDRTDLLDLELERLQSVSGRQSGAPHAEQLWPADWWTSCAWCTAEVPVWETICGRCFRELR